MMWGLGATLTTLVGLVMLLPLVLGPVTRLIAPLAPRFLRVEAPCDLWQPIRV